MIIFTILAFNNFTEQLLVVKDKRLVLLSVSFKVKDSCAEANNQLLLAACPSALILGLFSPQKPEDVQQFF